MRATAGACDRVVILRNGREADAPILHVKNFKDRTRELAAFIVRAQSVVADELVRAGGGALRAPPAVFVAGDMNIDSKFAKGMDASAQARAVLGAPLGKLPPAGTVKRDALERFEAELTARGARFAPPIDTLTTLKMRTRFQGQPEKAGDLTVAHRDFVVLPPRESTPSFALADTVLGGHFAREQALTLSGYCILTPWLGWIAVRSRGLG